MGIWEFNNVFQQKKCLYKPMKGPAILWNKSYTSGYKLELITKKKLKYIAQQKSKIEKIEKVKEKIIEK